MSTLDIVAEVLSGVAPRALKARQIAALAGNRLPTAARTPETVSRDPAFNEALPTVEVNAEKVVTCSQCGEAKPRSSFAKTGYRGSYRTVCKECRNVEAREYNTVRRASTTLRSSRLLASAKTRSQKHKLPFDLDRDWVQKRLDCGMCEATSIPFDMSTRRGWNTPSLDRINPAKGYTKNNTRLVLFALNAACGEWGEERLLEIVSARRRYIDRLEVLA